MRSGELGGELWWYHSERVGRPGRRTVEQEKPRSLGVEEERQLAEKGTLLLQRLAELCGANSGCPSGVPRIVTPCFSGGSRPCPHQACLPKAAQSGGSTPAPFQTLVFPEFIWILECLQSSVGRAVGC